MPPPTPLQLYATTTPGLEFVAQREVEALTGATATPDDGGVSFSCSFEQSIALHLHARTLNRVLLRLGTFHAPTWGALQHGIRALDLGPFLPPAPALDLHVTAHRSRLYHTGATAERITEALHATPDPAGAGLWVRLVDDACTLSVDLSGDLLHRRGYRHDVGKAPLRETTAAALLLASGYTGAEPLLNPACGTASFAIEAALIATRRAPGLRRTFAFERFPCFDPATLTALRAEALDAITTAPAPILATDTSPDALTAAHDNAARADLASAITLSTADATEPPPADLTPGLLICNPPWGKRLRADAPLYAALGAAWAQLSAWRAALLSTDKRLRRALEDALHRRPSQLRTFNQGGTRVDWTLYHVKPPK